MRFFGLSTPTDTELLAARRRADTTRWSGVVEVPEFYIARVPAYLVVPGAVVPRDAGLCSDCLDYADPRATLHRATAADRVRHGGCGGCGTPVEVEA